MGRVGLLLRQRSGDDATLLRRDLLAHTLLYMLRGAPVVYYGDEVGMMGSGGDKLARQDMFPTAVAEWRTEPRVGSPPIGAGSSFAVRDHPVAARLGELAGLRDGASRARDRAERGAARVRAAPRVSRFDLASRHEYLAAFNAGHAPREPDGADLDPGQHLGDAARRLTVRSQTAAGKLTLSTRPALGRAASAPTPRSRGRAPVRPMLAVAAGRADEPRPGASDGRDDRAGVRRVRREAGQGRVGEDRRRRLPALPGLPRAAALPARRARRGGRGRAVAGRDDDAVARRRRHAPSALTAPRAYDPRHGGGRRRPLDLIAEQVLPDGRPAWVLPLGWSHALLLAAVRPELRFLEKLRGGEGAGDGRGG